MRDTNNLKLRFEINLNQHYFYGFLVVSDIVRKKYAPA